MKRLVGVPLEVVYTNAARKELLQLEKSDGDVLQKAIEILAITGLGDIKPLKARSGVFRIRSGQTRAIFFVVQHDQVLTIIRVFYRQEGYKTKGRSRR